MEGCSVGVVWELQCSCSNLCSLETASVSSFIIWEWWYLLHRTVVENVPAHVKTLSTIPDTSVSFFCFCFYWSKIGVKHISFKCTISSLYTLIKDDHHCKSGYQMLPYNWNFSPTASTPQNMLLLFLNANPSPRWPEWASTAALSSGVLQGHC